MDIVFGPRVTHVMFTTKRNLGSKELAKGINMKHMVSYLALWLKIFKE